MVRMIRHDANSMVDKRMSGKMTWSYLKGGTTAPSEPDSKSSRLALHGLGKTLDSWKYYFQEEKSCVQRKGDALLTASSIKDWSVVQLPYLKVRKLGHAEALQ